MKLQKRLAASLLNASPQRVILDPTKLDKINEAVTKFDVRKLVREHLITLEPVRGTSRVRARQRQRQKRKGRLRGFGVRKGRQGARHNAKRTWIHKIRAQRRFLTLLKHKKLLTTKNFSVLYQKAKGGFFRSVHHLKLYINENNLVNK